MSLARENKALNAYPEGFLFSKHAAILKELVKRPDNKLCVDCKKNDARWASVNLGVFMCIRCSGIHRSLGVHITRIKSIDLDTWSPEQVSVVQRWGNRRANKYWEAHLKPGHIPSDSKVESFIRSKYESKRWVMEGPKPEPESLDDGDAAPSAPAAAPAPNASSARSPQQLNLFDDSGPTQAAAAAPAAPKPGTSKAPATSATSAGGGGGLFDLDFSSPPSVSPPPANRAASSKADILSLFSQPAAPRQPQQAGPPGGNRAPQPQSMSDAFAGLTFDSPAPAAARTNPPAAQSFASPPQDWGMPSNAASTAAPKTQQHHQPAFSGMFDSSDVWGSSSSTQPPQAAPAPTSSNASAGFGDFGDFTSSTPASSGSRRTTTTASSMPPGFDDFGDIWKS